MGKIGRKLLVQLARDLAVPLDERAEQIEVCRRGRDGGGKVLQQVRYEPVVAVDEQQIVALSQLDTAIARRACAAVRLMQGAHLIRVRGRIAVADRAGCRRASRRRSKEAQNPDTSGPEWSPRIFPDIPRPR